MEHHYDSIISSHAAKKILDQEEADRKLGASLRKTGWAIHEAISEEIERQLNARLKSAIEATIAELKKREIA